MINIAPISTNLVSFCRSHWDLSNDTKIVKIGAILIMMKRQKLLCNAVVIVRPGHYNEYASSKQKFNILLDIVINEIER